jgi:hypothetical protein
VSHTTTAGGSGAVLFIALLILFQQFGYLSLTEFLPSIVLLIVVGIIGGLLFGGITWALERHHH